MTDNEADILARLQAIKDAAAASNCQGTYLGSNAADVGGKDASHHSTTLRRMAEPAKAWVEVMKVAPRHNRYRITDKGVQALANHKLMKVKT